MKITNVLSFGVLALASACSGGSSSSSVVGTVVPTVGGLFEQPEPWTQDVSGADKAGASDAIIAELVGDGGWGAGNALKIDFSIPVLFADSSTQEMKVDGASNYCYGGPDCNAVPMMMPVPTNGNFEGSTDLSCDTNDDDCHMLVVDESQKKLFEVYNGTSNGSELSVLGIFVWDLTKAYPDNERGENCTSADAGGFPIAGLLPTADEVAAGEVKHALRFILPNSRMKKGVYVHPASHAGSPENTDDNAPPYGVRFRLKADFDDSTFDAGEKVIIASLKKYGMLLSDGGNIALTFADDRTSTAKWSDVGVQASSFNKIGVDDFEVVNLGDEVQNLDNCALNE